MTLAVVLTSAVGCASAPGSNALNGPPATSPPKSPADCGSYTAGMSEEGVTDRGWSCFDAALRRHDVAVLRLTKTTTEGDPVAITFTSRPDGAADVLTDSSKDRFGGGSRMQYEVCSTLDTRPVAKKAMMFLRCS